MKTRTPRTERGFSLIEVLIAGVILMVIALGMVPLFTRAIASNVSGFSYTEVSNFARSRAEEFLQYPFNSPRLTVAAGDEALEIEDFYSEREDRWQETLDAGDTALFTRTTTIRQFGVTDLTNPLDGGVPPGAVHLKEITVEVEGIGLAGSLGTGKMIAVRVLKSQ